jgi:hypothetical protein
VDLPAKYSAAYPLAQSASETSAPAANVAAVVQYGGQNGLSHAIYGVAWSYNGSPTGGNLMIQDGVTVVFQVDITAAGPGSFNFAAPLQISVGSTMTITLAAGGSGISGKVDAIGHYVSGTEGVTKIPEMIFYPNDTVSSGAPAMPLDSQYLPLIA